MNVGELKKLLNNVPDEQELFVVFDFKSKPNASLVHVPAGKIDEFIKVSATLYGPYIGIVSIHGFY